MKALLSISALSSLANAIIPVAVVSRTPYDCDAIHGVDITFSPDRNSIHAFFPQNKLSILPPAHGNPGGDGFVGCSATVQFDDFPTQVRFAITNVTWYNDHVNLSQNTVFQSLKSKIQFNVEHLQNYYPTRCPLIKDLSWATLVDLDVIPDIGGESYEGEFKFTQENPNRVWSICFNNSGANTTKIDFTIQSLTKGAATSSPGWTMDFGLIWEECYPSDEIRWGQRIIRAWESCTYRESNQTCYSTLQN